MMNILHLSTNDFGGAGTAAVRIHLAHLNGGDNSLLLVRNMKNSNPSVFQIPQMNFINKICKIYSVIRRKILFDENYFVYNVLDDASGGVEKFIRSVRFFPDVIVLHWVSGFVSYSELVFLSEKYQCRVLQFLMDMAPITGGCHFSNGCLGYTAGCVSCPAAINNYSKRLVRKRFIQLQYVHNKLDTVFVSPNNFVDGQVFNSMYSSGSVACIPVDEGMFYPSENHYDSRPFRVLFGSHDLDGGRKGGKYFKQLLVEYDRHCVMSGVVRKIEVVVPGLSQSNFFESSVFDFVQYDRIDNESDLGVLYRNVDLYVCCSIEDSGPMMVSEALMSGVPVLAFGVGICPEVIENGRQGFVVPMFDVNDMLGKLLMLLGMTAGEYSEMRESARLKALSYCSNEAYLQQINKIIAAMGADVEG